jgi:hypothetical protein
MLVQVWKLSRSRTLMLAVVVGAVDAGCSASEPAGPGNGAGSSTSVGGAGSTGTSSSSSSSSSGAGACGSGQHVPGMYDPDDSCWAPVQWPNHCNVEVALQPALGAPPLVWEPCGDGTAGCSQQQPQAAIDHKTQFSKASVVAWAAGYRIGIAEVVKDGGRIASVYDVDGAPLVAWRTLEPTCELVRPIVTSERVWFGAIHVTPRGATESTYVAPTWAELSTVNKTVQLSGPVQAWWASSDVVVGWIFDGKTLFIEDLVTGQTFQFGGSGGQGNPDYAYPHVVGASVVALTAPDGMPDVTVWNRSTGWPTDLVNPSPLRVADANSDGQTLAWIVTPDWESPGELWTSPMATTPAELSPTLRRGTPVVQPSGSAAGSGHYAVYSPKEVFGEGPGDNRVHVYRLNDARHWSFPFPSSYVWARWIYHVDAGEVFYSGVGPLARQRLDVLGEGD